MGYGEYNKNISSVLALPEEWKYEKEITIRSSSNDNKNKNEIPSGTQFNIFTLKCLHVHLIKNR